MVKLITFAHFLDYQKYTTQMQECINTTYGNQTTASLSLCLSPDSHHTSGIPILSTFSKISIGTISSFLVLTGFLGNAVVCFIVYRKPQMRSAINLLLASMALSDIVMSVVCVPLPLITIIHGRWIFGDVVCKIQAFLVEYLTSVAILILFIMSGDRYMIIVKRRDKLTAKFAKILILLVWTIPLVTSLPPAVGLSDYKLFSDHTQCSLAVTNKTYDISFLAIKFTLSFVFPILLTGYAFSAITNTVRTNSFRIDNHPDTEVSLNIAQMSATLGFILIPMKTKLDVDVKFKTRTFKTIMLLYVLVILCISPYSINQIVSNTTGLFQMNRDTIFLWIAFSKSSINPVIYFFRVKKFKETCEEFVPICCRSVNINVLSRRRVNPSSLYQVNGDQSIASISSTI
ncbi:high-affinity lysophosphatidic acid receptor-like [Mytilus edulis]|uniref:high-affinity lysophosphatidic acid receptor-like n=1 Tax=Mytilus edulis TaxID=6550 RepID=UPI0039EE2E01